MFHHILAEVLLSLDCTPKTEMWKTQGLFMEIQRKVSLLVGTLEFGFIRD